MAAGSAVVRLPEVARGQGRLPLGLVVQHRGTCRPARRAGGTARRSTRSATPAPARWRCSTMNRCASWSSPAPGQVVAQQPLQRRCVHGGRRPRQRAAGAERLLDRQRRRALPGGCRLWLARPGRARWSSFDVDTPLDLALLRLGTTSTGTRMLDGVVAAFLEQAEDGLPPGMELLVPRRSEIGEVIRSRDRPAAGGRPNPVGRLGLPGDGVRLPGPLLHRGARHAIGARPGPALAACRLDGAPGAGRSDPRAGHPGRRGDPRQPGADGRASGIIGRSRLAARGGPFRLRLPATTPAIETAWLRELTQAAAEASVPVLLGGHALVSDGLRLLVDAAWLDRCWSRRPHRAAGRLFREAAHPHAASVP